MEELKSSLSQYNEQLCMIREALVSTKNEEERKPLLALQSELEELVKLTQESVDTLAQGTGSETDKLADSTPAQEGNKDQLDDEFALFMQEMAESGAYDDKNVKKNEESSNTQEENDTSDIEDELSTLLGMKCAVYHTHKWGGQPSLHNAMVSAVVPHQDSDQFSDLQVQVLFTHPTHAEMLPCPFYLEGSCRFDDEKCRFSHGAVVPLSDLKDAIEPNFSTIKAGSRVLLKRKPPDDEDISLTKKSMEKYHLWHRAIVKNVDFEEKLCTVKMEHGTQAGEKRKSGSDEHCVHFEEIFPLNNDCDTSSDSDDSLSDTEYPEHKTSRVETEQDHQALVIEKSLQNNGPAMGEWERHTRGIGSKLMLAMGYVPGTGLGAAAGGRVQPVEARVLPVGKSLDHCMAISEKAAAQDPLKVTQKLRKLQKKEEERNKRAYEREKERHDRNVFNFLNRTLGNKQNLKPSATAGPSTDIKQSSTKELNVEQFKIAEDTRRIEREIIKLNTSLARQSSGSEGYRNISKQLVDRNTELNKLKSKEQQITKEKNFRKNKHNMTVF